jgi:tRNA U54 and U55 pseudouridine synthase Pus10
MKYDLRKLSRRAASQESNVYLESMDETDRKELIEALDDYTITAPTISRVLERRGIDLDASSINKYRRGEFTHVTKG